MKSLIDSIVVTIYVCASAWGGKYTLSSMANKAQSLAFEKVIQGLDDLSPITQKMTGKKYEWQ